MTEKRTMSLDEWAREMGVGRSLAYELARKGEIPGLIHLGSRWLVSREVTERLLNGDVEPKPAPKLRMVH